MKRPRYGRRYRFVRTRYLVASVIVVAVIVGTIIYGRYLQDMLKDYDEVVHPDDTSVTLPIDSQTPQTTQPPESTETEYIISSLSNYKGAYLNLQEYATIEDFETVANEWKEKGFTAVTIDVKYESGKLAYVSQLEQVLTTGSNQEVPMPKLEEIVQIFHAKDFFVTGRFSVFRDDMAAATYRDMAIKHISGMRWMDEKSRWISVYSEAGRQYMIDLMKEIHEAGVDELLLYNYHLPYTARTKNPREIAYEDGIDKHTIVNQFIQEIKDQIPTLNIGLLVPHDILSAGACEIAGIRVEDLSKIADFIAADFSLSKISSSAKINGETFPSPKKKPFESIQALCHEFAALSEAIPFRPVIESIDNGGEVDTAQIEALTAGGYYQWEWVKYQ